MDSNSRCYKFLCAMYVNKAGLYSTELGPEGSLSLSSICLSVILSLSLSLSSTVLDSHIRTLCTYLKFTVKTGEANQEINY